MRAKGALFGGMLIDFDPAKSMANMADPAREFGFELAAAFEFDDAFIELDDRKDYGEIRLVGLGRIGPRLHVIVFTIRTGTLWVISLRKANDREVRRYERDVDERAGGEDRPPFPRTH